MRNASTIESVRKILSLLLLLVLPLYFSAAAVAALCLPGAAVVAHAHGGGAGSGHAHDHHGAAMHAQHADGHAGPQAGGPAPDPAAQAHGDAGWLADASGCCHAAASALPTQHAIRFNPPALPALILPPPRPVASHPAEGLFRPPRTSLA